TPDTPGWLPSLREESNKLKSKKTLKIKLVNSRFSVNDTLETAAALAKRIEFFTLKNIGNYHIDIEIDKVSSYQSFVQLYDLMCQSIYLNRMEFARRNLSKEYDPSKNWDSSLQDTLSQVFPLNLWLLNEKERVFVQKNID
ncbi:MAG TPA: hypothetical protein PLJ08_12175, partial [Cyclobacteriaceae bacterium]|nr:hypothetical protein [Cyclobacteriaceae bacterium]